jgi:hypothetical protein
VPQADEVKSNKQKILLFLLLEEKVPKADEVNLADEVKSRPLEARSYRSRIELKKAKNPSRQPILPYFKKHTLSLTLKQIINSGI